MKDIITFFFFFRNFFWCLYRTVFNSAAEKVFDINMENMLQVSDAKMISEE